ncbi:MAG TPA: hypothetical protein VGP72_02655 [Planctomycetota bacterium]|jgi:hypothetical protein
MIESNIKHRLLVLRSSLRKACALDGFSRLVLVGVLCVLGAIVLDYFFFRSNRPVNTAFRIVMSLAIIGGLATLLYRRLVSPLLVPLSLDDMALAVEREFPHLNDSLISTVQLTRMLADDRTISAPMVEEVARQAYQQTAALEFSRVVKFNRIRPVLFGALGSLLLIGSLGGISVTREYLGVGLLRLLNPLSRQTYPVRTQIEVTIDGHRGIEKIVPRNEGTSIIAIVTGELPGQAFIEFDHGKGYSNPEPVNGKTRTNEQTGQKLKEFQYDYNPVISSFSFRIKANDNEAGPFSVRAVDRPDIANMTVTYKFPSYITDKPSEPKRERSLRAVVGTEATLNCTFNKPMRSDDGVMIKLGNDDPKPMILTIDGMTAAYPFTMDESKDYEIFLRDRDGLDNKNNKIRHKVWVLPDALPRLTWKTPAADLEVTPMATVALALGLEDDWGLRKGVIKFKRYKGVAPAPQQNVAGARNQAPVAIDPSSPVVTGSFDLPEPQPGAFNKSAQKLDITKDWSLAELGLESGDVVEYWAEAYDWCPTARKGTEPQVYHFRVLSSEEIRRKLDIERLRLIEDLKVIIRDEENDRKQVDAIKDHISVGNPFAPADRTKVSEAGALQEEVRRKTHALQNAFDTLIQRYIYNGLDTPDDKDRLTAIRDVLETEHTKKMPDASREISASALARADDDRVLNLKNAIKKQDEIISDLKALLEQMQKWAETEDLLRMTRELLLKQRNVTRLTAEFKDRLGAKKPSEATKEEQGQVTGLSHEQRDCATDMRALFERMTQAYAKMMELDKFVAKNIDDAIKIAQNTDATPDKPDLATTGDPSPGIEDKMRAAQTQIKDNFAFGTAGSKQRGAETGLERIITVLSRRRDVDKEMMKDIQRTANELRNILERQRELLKRTDDIRDKAALERSIAQAKQQLQDIRNRQEKLKEQTQNLQNTPDPQAGKLEESLASAQKDLEQLIKDQNQVFKDTVDQLSPAEREIARAVHELELLEVEERALAKESNDISDGKAEKVLREHYDRMKKLRVSQEALRAKVNKEGSDLKAVQDDQARLRADTAGALTALAPAADDLNKTVKEILAKAGDAAKDTPQVALLQAAARALTQAGSLALQAPDEMKNVTVALSENKAKDAAASQLNATEKLARAEEVLLKALGIEHKRFEDASIDQANRQADTRGKLDELTNRMANLIRAANTPDQGAKDKKLAAAGKSAAQAMPELEGSSRDMSDGSDTLRRGAPSGDRSSSMKASGLQTSAADRLKKAREILQGASGELAKDKAAEHGKVGQQQTGVQTRTKGLQEKLDKLAKDIDQAHASASGTQPKNDPAGAASKVAEAADKMAQSSKDLGKPDPAAATKNESKAIDALEDAKDKLADMRRKIEELKTPSRRLERDQKDLKDDARKLGAEVKKLQDQLPENQNDKKPADNVKNASSNMQNAQNNLGKEGKSGEGDQKEGPDTKGASQEQEKALSELDKALDALNELAAKAAKEKDPRAPEVLNRLKPIQNALRDEVQRLQKKLDNFRDKTGNRNAEKAAAANESASRNQSAAAGQMGQGNQSGSKSSEEEAEQDLQDALENLDQFQNQMQQQNRSEQLFQIEQELKKMLGVQRDLLTKTQDVEKQRPAPAGKEPAPLPRRARGMLRQVFEDQQKLSDSAKVVVKKLEDAPVFQFVLQGAGNDMSEAAARLDKEESGSLTQDIEDDVIRNLADLIEALRKERQEQQKQQGGGGGGGGGGKQPLVPPLAELKMLRIMQRNVNSQTKKIDDEVNKTKAEQKDLNKDQKDRLRRSAVKEGEIARITKRIADELNSGPQAPPVPGEDDAKDKDKEKDKKEEK